MPGASFSDPTPFFSSKDFAVQFEVIEGQSFGVEGTGIFDRPSVDSDIGDYRTRTEAITLTLPTHIGKHIKKNDIVQIKDDPNMYKVVGNHPDGTGVSVLQLVHLTGKTADVRSRD